MKRLFSLLLVMFFTLTISSVYGQGVTTASLKGRVLDKNGDGINGFVTIQAINQANNSEYVTMTFADGNYKLQGLQVGGPYKIIAVLTGYKTQEKDNVFLQLNQEAVIDFVLSTDEQEIEEVVVSADVLEANKTGAVTSVGLKQIEVMPTISRSQNDMTRLNPLANGTSFGGRNKLYNNFSLDGSVFNNSFGLDDATPGGQSDAQPVSLDALEQIQVSLAPFDVREGGFSGAGINAVTKSGTNDLKASLYYYTRNENMIGKKVGDLEIENTDFSTMLTGFTVGGPIIKDKLFFFISAEAERIDALAHGFVADNGTNSGANVTSVSEADIIAVQQHLINEWGYEPGRYQGYNHKTASDKILAKLNWNINKKHKFSIRYNMLQAYKDHTPHPEAIIGRGPTSYRLPFENSSYRINNNIYSVVSELNSRFSNKLFNKVLVGYTAFRDYREPKSEPFPVIDIFDVNGNLAITAGMEMFSTNNVLDQDIYQFNDNLTYYAEKHTITGGINFEMFQFNNSFNLFYYPWHLYFGGVDGFLNTTVADVDYNAEVTNSQTKEFAMAEVDVAQLAFYIQDEFELTNTFNLTAGLRVDMPLYFNQIEEDTNITGFVGWKDTDGNDVTVDPSIWPSNNLMWSPRIGFNWAAMKNLKVRGGTGIFTGRIPFVWLGNQSTNSNIDPGYEFQVNDTEEGFKYPQVWKTDLAVDVIAGNGWFFTLEGIYGKDINAIVHRNYDMLKPTGKLSGADDRAIFAGFNESHIYASDPGTTTFLDAGVIVMENVSEGYQGSLTAQVKKNFDFGVNLFAAYSYLESKDYTSIPAEIAADAFGRNPVVGDPNQSMFSYSRYGLKHRFITSASYQIEYKKNFATSIGLFYELGKGNRYSYIYAGDLNQDGIGHNDLLYVPASSSEIHFGTVAGGVGTEATDAAAQWTTLEAYINQDEYLSTRKGNYAERNGGMLPWFSQLDVSLAQDFSIDVKGKKNTLRLSVDILNFGNLVNSSWGVRKIVATNAPIALSGIDSNSVPYYSVSPNLSTTFIDDTSIASKWQIQFGIRYIFN